MSSRVLEPCGPVPPSSLRSTPRSRASFRTGGLASARPPPSWARTVIAAGTDLTGVTVAGAGAVGAAVVIQPAGAGVGGAAAADTAMVLRRRRVVVPGLTP